MAATTRCPNCESGDIVAERHHVAGQLMSEDGRRNDHARVVASLEHLHIGAAGQRDLHSYEDVSPVNLGHGHRLHLQVFLAVKDGSHHLAFHYKHLCG